MVETTESNCCLYMDTDHMKYMMMVITLLLSSALMAELADAWDLKSQDNNIVRVRFSLRALDNIKIVCYTTQ